MTPNEPASGTMFAHAIDAATVLAAQDGRIPSLDRIAARLGVAVPALLAVVGSEEQLHQSIALNAFTLLNDQMVGQVVQVPEDDVLGQFVAIADAYVEWACDHPAAFHIIAMIPGEEFSRNESLSRYEASIHDLMLRLLRRAQSLGRLAPDEDLEMLVAIAHSFAYGAASRMLSGDLPRWLPQDDTRAGAHRAMAFFTRKMLYHPACAAPAGDGDAGPLPA